MKRSYACAILVSFLIFWMSSLVSSGELGPLRLHPENPRYFMNTSGDLVFLTGSHTWAVVQDIGVVDEVIVFDYQEFLAFLKSYNHNYLRLWIWEHVSWMHFAEPSTVIRYDPPLFRRTGPGMAKDGLPKFNLTQFNQDFFERIKQRVRLAQEREIYVSVMLFQGFSIEQKGQKGIDPAKGNPWDGHPFNRDNNMNNIDGDLNENGQGEETHTLVNKEILKIQEAFVKKMIDTLNGFDNLIWEISNESHIGTTEWQYHMIDVIKEYEKTKEYQHPVKMSFQWSSYKKEGIDSLINSSAEVISPGRYDSPDYIPEGLDIDDRVVILDTDHIDPRLKKIDYSWPWKSFLSGFNPILMDGYKDVLLGNPPEPAKEYEHLRRSMGQVRVFTEKLDLVKLEPNEEISSNRYSLANPGIEYVFFKPQFDSGLEVKLLPGKYTVDRYMPQAGDSKESDILEVKRKPFYSRIFGDGTKLFLDFPEKEMGIVHIKKLPH